MRVAFSLLLSVFCFHLQAQQVKLDDIKRDFSKDKFFKINGGVSANSICNFENGSSAYEPFNYFINGNLSINIASLVDLPFSFALTNSGSNMTYPTLPNRFSLHPSYKWISAHVGDVSMNFSPYTLSGHQFTGVGIDFSPPGCLKGSIMYGRLQRKVEYDTIQKQIPAAYKRMGYGAKLRYDKKDFYIGSSYLHTYDDLNSLKWKPDSLGILPQKNTAANWEFGIKPLKNFQLSAEYALSMLTRDVRAAERKENLFDLLFGLKTSTSNYDAYKFNAGYQFLKSVIGVGYERVSSGYKTLGAYYSNSDFENFTTNFSTILFKDKVNFSTNIGLEHNDLENSNDRKTSRLVGSLNITYNPIKSINITGSYSNFQTHSNAKSQFDYINQTSPTENLDTLNFEQVSQNGTFSVMYQLEQSEKRTQSFNANVNYQIASDKQGGVVLPNNSNSLANASIAYAVQFIPQSININTTFNITQNQTGQTQTTMVGPTISVSTKLLKKVMTIGFSSAYNVSESDGVICSSVFNGRFNVGYLLLKKHNFILSGLYHKVNTIFQPSKYSININTTYSYSF